MSAEIIIATWPKNSREEIRVRLDSYKGQPTVCIRAWYKGMEGEIKPGRGGLTVSVRHLPDLTKAVAKALDVAKASGLIADAVPPSTE